VLQALLYVDLFRLSCYVILWFCYCFSDDVHITERSPLNNGRGHQNLLKIVHDAIEEGAEAFLRREYSICLYFVIAFSIIVFSFVSWGQNTKMGFLTMLSFDLGACTSILSGYIGMRVAVYSNVRTTICAMNEGYKDCFNTAFRAGAVMVSATVL
jgi:Na+/H+-translocating membrane pyrophosphatase